MGSLLFSLGFRDFTESLEANARIQLLLLCRFLGLNYYSSWLKNVVLCSLIYWNSLYETNNEQQMHAGGRIFEFSVQGIHKRMVRFWKLINILFLTLHGLNKLYQQRELSMFLMRYKQFAYHAYFGAAGPVSKMASQQEKAFCVLQSY
jgi:hypothetical protein